MPSNDEHDSDAPIPLIRTVFQSINGAFLGGVLWVFVAYTARYEISFVAILVGLLAGAGASKGANGRGGRTAGVIAAIIAVATNIMAKIVSIVLIAQNAKTASAPMGPPPIDLYDLLFLLLAIGTAYKTGSSTSFRGSSTQRPAGE